MLEYYNKAIILTDITSLNYTDTSDQIKELCEQAHTAYANVAAVCIYPKFINVAKKNLTFESAIKIATVCNFPYGTAKLKDVLYDVENIINLGADEIDLVIPYQELIDTYNTNKIYLFIKNIKDLCGPTIKIKAIIESGILSSKKLIETASSVVCDAGGDFIKTSTGKTTKNATLEAASWILNIIKKNNYPVGFKASGGIKTANDAINYLKLAEKIMGYDWLSVDNFRFGASSLIDNLLSELSS